MSKLAFLSSGAGVTVGAGGLVIGAIAIGAYALGVFDGAPVVAPQAEPAALVQSDAPVSKPKETGQDAAVTAPSFDVVRVETDGSAMIAGRALAGSTVAIRLDDTVIGEVEADASGKFASFLSLPESTAPRVLTLDVKGGEISADQVIITPIEKVEPVVEVAADEKTIETAQVASEATPLPEPTKAPAVLLAKEGSVRVLQSPEAAKPEAMTALLGAISYDDAGDVALTGRASGEFVRVYLNNRAITTSQIAENGDWQAGLPAVDTGIYTLRVDELNAAGDVVARVETPFKREAAEVLAAATAPEKPLQAITVQPGATLWAIAQERYGSGILYARVVEANADAIKDPDLIYPGQVFTVPD